MRVVLRALALLQLAEHASAPQIAKVIPLTARAVRQLGHRYEDGGLDRALYEKQRPGAVELLDSNQKQHGHGMQRSAGRPGALDRATGS